MPFTKGDPNINRGGRPKKGETLTEALKEKADKNALADKLIAMAMSGDFPALKYVYDRIDGTPKQTIAGDNESPLMQGFKIVFEDPEKKDEEK